MNDLTKYDPETGEVMSTAVSSIDPSDIPLAVRLARVELDQAVSTARAYPMHTTNAQMAIIRDRVASLVMLDEETAHECVYALPRGGKPIKGPSIRLAEVVAQQYGNCKIGTRIKEVNKFEKYIEAEAIFMDLETGFQFSTTTRRKISDKSGRVYNDDMIVVTGNAAMSIARREAILKGIPKSIWNKAYQTAENVIAGDIKTLAERREGAIRAFATWGITPDQIFASLEIGGMDEIGMDEIATLTAMFKAIKAGEQQVEDYFPSKAKAADGVEAAKGTAAKLEGIAKGGKADPDKEAQKEADHRAAENNRADDAARQRMQDERDAKAKAKGKAAPDAAQDGQKQAEDGPGATDTAADPEKAASGPENGAGDDEGDGDGRPPNDEEVERAYNRGVTAGKRGMKPNLIPEEYRAHQRLFDAWNDGHAEGVEAAKAEAK